MQEGTDNCALTYVSQLLSSSAVPSAVFSPIGNCLAAANFSTNDIQMFAVDPDSCTFEIGETVDFSQVQVLGYLGFTANGRCLSFTGPGLIQLTRLFMFSTNIVVPPIITQALLQCDGTLVVTGTATPGLSIQIFVDGNPVGGSVAVGVDGMFEAIVGPVSLATHVVTAVATNIDTGCSSEPSNSVEVTAPEGPTINNLQTTCLNTVIISGTAAPGIPVSIFVDDNPTSVGMGLPNNQGIFTVATQPIPIGVHCFTAVQQGCPSAVPVCVNIIGQSCTLSSPNLAFGTHCNV